MLRVLAVSLLLSLAACGRGEEAPPTGFSSERISVEVRGSGPDVVLIPGLGSSPEVWESTIAAVPGHRYHLVQVAGFAGKPPGANASGPIIEPVAEEIARYIAEAGLDRPALVGHSLGGTLAMVVAARHPERISRLMVVDMLPFVGVMFTPPGVPATPDVVRPIAAQVRLGIVGATGATRRAATEQAMAAMVRSETLRPRALAHSLSSDPAVAGQAMYELITTDLRPELARIQVPMTVLWVRAPNAPLDEAQMEQLFHGSYANAPQAQLVHVPDAYHFIMWDAPEAFQRELRRFLRSRPSGTAR